MTIPTVITIPAASAVALNTATAVSIVSAPLGARTWLVWGVLDATLASATVTALAASLSLVSGALAAQPGAYVAPGRLYPEPSGVPGAIERLKAIDAQITSLRPALVL
jgi:hypothetical protein